MQIGELMRREDVVDHRELMKESLGVGLGIIGMMVIDMNRELERP